MFDDQLDRIQRDLGNLQNTVIGLHRKLGRRPELPSNTILRSIVAQLVAHDNRQTIGAVVEALYPDKSEIDFAVKDPSAYIRLKAATNPARTDSSTWAMELT